MVGTESGSELLLFVMLGICFLAHKMRWKESSFFFAVAAVFFAGMCIKILVLIGPEPRFPLFLIFYMVMTVVCVGSGLVERSQERKSPGTE